MHTIGQPLLTGRILSLFFPPLVPFARPKVSPFIYSSPPPLSSSAFLPLFFSYFVLWSLPSRFWPICDKHSWIEEHPQSSLDVLSSKDHVPSPVFLDRPALSGNSASSTIVCVPSKVINYCPRKFGVNTHGPALSSPVALASPLSIPVDIC
ncbi:hypothetical protein I7I48_09472 [Histoplasma ohiense]|nr:hypothetical protein I7I48_09472 [Histoplasma ohiense (nom. inval.)]